MVSLLALASKPLYEREVLALRSEVESLRLQVFWAKNGVPQLSEAMRRANTFPADAPHCSCVSCISFSRDAAPRVYEPRCRFSEWFEQTAARRFDLITLRFHPPVVPALAQSLA